MQDSPRGAGAFGRQLGATVVDPADKDAFDIAMDAGDAALNAAGVVHGGVQMSLLDMAMAGAVGRVLTEGESCASVSITTDFVRPASPGRLVARGRLERRGKLTAFPSAELYDTEGRLVARATGIWAIRPPTA